MSDTQQNICLDGDNFSFKQKHICVEVAFHCFFHISCFLCELDSAKHDLKVVVEK